MSILKLENKLKLLTAELETIDTAISDPIERNEHKKLLQKQIKKLNQTKDNLVKLQQEEAELESLRTDFIVAQQPDIIPESPQQIQSEQVSYTTNDEYWDEQSCPTIADDSDSLLAAEEAPEKIIKPQQNHFVYLSKREIWISCVFAIFSFIFPYIYTRRWKPLFILLMVMISISILTSKSSSLIAAPWLSAIDNGTAIAQAKKKIKLKLL
ncbi:hypothetical protein NIES4102_06870 [Chondrocystis sp. NIES-4102]|nr:hypothetical protein NIES4102_06870 [Chondrocystis sp. NIES-4102]